MEWTDIKILKKSSNVTNLLAKIKKKPYLIELRSCVNPNILNKLDLTKKIPSISNSYLDQYMIGNTSISVFKKYSRELKKKMSKSVDIIFKETDEEYKNRTGPYIENCINKGNIKWIYDILHHNSEKNRIVYQDDIFILMKDILWSNNKKDEIYLLALPRNETLRTIRDLDSKNLALLEHMKKVITHILQKKFKIKKEHVYMFFHYLPSFFHLHLHVCGLTNINMQKKFGRHHLLDNIIQNIQFKNDYYQKVTLIYEIPTKHSLFKNIKPVDKIASI
jgi:m7GpppX diphosphatase